jgi:hypothetical protein
LDKNGKFLFKKNILKLLKKKPHNMQAIYTPSTRNAGPFGVGPENPLAVKIMGTSRIVPDGQARIVRLSKTHVGLVINGSVLFKELNCFRESLQRDLESLTRARKIIEINAKNMM